ncbi:MAG: class I SAM-dependent methyltransferase [Candidatus Sungbacteria bacterium]|nr:class I SAM-dependent methyltransferase [Candidatus Sungbacteria bacterium]
MPYDEKFFEAYREYLKEPIVRKNHDHVFRIFAYLMLTEIPHVMDLGCGIGEYAMYDPYHMKYVGIDLHNPEGIKPFIQTDYTALDFMGKTPFRPNAFISLFSTELFLSDRAKYAFYERIFRELLHIRFGMVSGFFYESRRRQKILKELEGTDKEVTSRQTIEHPSRYISDHFTEMRIHMHTPSQMFGQDVVEVWKIFVRR